MILNPLANPRCTCVVVYPGRKLKPDPDCPVHPPTPRYLTSRPVIEVDRR